MAGRAQPDHAGYLEFLELLVGRGRARWAEPLVELMEHAADASEPVEADPESKADPDDKVVPISTARSERPNTPPPTPDEAPDALQA